MRAIPLLFLAYNAAYYLPFGGQSPGPRFLVPALPFLVVPLAFVLRARPCRRRGVGLVSVGVMALATITGPLTGRRVRDRDLARSLSSARSWWRRSRATSRVRVGVGRRCAVRRRSSQPRSWSRSRASRSERRLRADWPSARGRCSAAGRARGAPGPGPRAGRRGARHARRRRRRAALLGLTLAVALRSRPQPRCGALLLRSLPAVVLAAPPIRREAALVAARRYAILCVASSLARVPSRAPGRLTDLRVRVRLSKPPLATHCRLSRVCPAPLRSPP